MITYSGISELGLREALCALLEAGTKVIAVFDTLLLGRRRRHQGAAAGHRRRRPGAGREAENGIVVITSLTGTELSRESKDLQHGHLHHSPCWRRWAARPTPTATATSHSASCAATSTRVQASGRNRQHPTVRVPGEKDWEARIALAQR